MRLAIGLVIALECGSAVAGFSLTTLDPGGGAAFAETSSRLQALTAASGDEKVQKGFVFPFTGTLKAEAGSPGGGQDYSLIEQDQTFRENLLRIDVARAERFRRGMVGTNGAFVFTVDAPTRALVSGAISADAPTTNEQLLSASLTDLSTGLVLMESIQSTAAASVRLSLGGLLGNRASTFSGSLVNDLSVGHVYRLTYTVSNQGFEAGSDATSMTAFISVSAVPEASTTGMLLVGVSILALNRRLRTTQPWRVGLNYHRGPSTV